MPWLNYIFYGIFDYELFYIDSITLFDSEWFYNELFFFLLDTFEFDLDS